MKEQYFNEKIQYFTENQITLHYAMLYHTTLHYATPHSRLIVVLDFSESNTIVNIFLDFSKQKKQKKICDTISQIFKLLRDFPRNHPKVLSRASRAKTSDCYHEKEGSRLSSALRARKSQKSRENKSIHNISKE